MQTKDQPAPATSPPPRVFIAERPQKEGIDFKAAEAHGSLVFVLADRGATAFDPPSFVQRVRLQLELSSFDPTRDFFCMVGPLASTSLVLAQLFVRYRTLNILIYNRHTGQYACRTVDMRGEAA